MDKKKGHGRRAVEMSSRKDVIHGHAGYASKDVFSCERGNVHTPAPNPESLISKVHPGPSGSFVTGKHSIGSMNNALWAVCLPFAMGTLKDWRRLAVRRQQTSAPLSLAPLIPVAGLGIAHALHRRRR